MMHLGPRRLLCEQGIWPALRLRQAVQQARWVRSASSAAKRAESFPGPAEAAEESNTLRLRSLIEELAPGDLRPAFAMAYGSGVYSQGSMAGDTKGKMVDIVLAVRDPVSWHRAMMKVRPQDYSTVARWSPRSLLDSCQRAGAGVWYHPYVDVLGTEVKYGVISLDGLVADLREWTTLYVSGRMHKPVATIVPNYSIDVAQIANLRSALRAALLLLPQRFTMDHLLASVVGLSYTGDWRMDVPGGENAHKVCNIVRGQRNELIEMYAPLLARVAPGVEEVVQPTGPAGTASGAELWEQDFHPEARARLAAFLPRHLAARMAAHYGAPSLPAPPAFWERVVKDPQMTGLLRRQIGTIVRQPAFAQSVKGVYTAGFGRSWRYVRSKMSKYSEGQRQG